MSNLVVQIEKIRKKFEDYSAMNRDVYLPCLPHFASVKIYQNEELSIEIISRVNSNIEESIERLTVDYLIENICP